MLDQNTDRMWYVIGAVLIGAAIIFAANALFDDVIFKQIGQFMDGLLGGARSAVEEGGMTVKPAPDAVINLFKTVPFF